MKHLLVFRICILACGSALATPTLSPTSTPLCTPSCQPGYGCYPGASPTCAPCAAGEASPTGSKCEACPAGKFAAVDNSYSSSGGQEHPVNTLATGCFSCPAGYFSGSASSIVCQSCTSPKSSYPGSTACDAAAESFYIDAYNAILDCPKNAHCSGLNYLPRPTVDHWIDRRSVSFAGKPHLCRRATCIGSKVSSCWTLQAYSNNSFGDGKCDSDVLQCDTGAHGPLCGGIHSNLAHKLLAENFISPQDALKDTHTPPEPGTAFYAKTFEQAGLRYSVY